MLILSFRLISTHSIEIYLFALAFWWFFFKLFLNEIQRWYCIPFKEIIQKKRGNSQEFTKTLSSTNSKPWTKCISYNIPGGALWDRHSTSLTVYIFLFICFHCLMAIWLIAVSCFQFSVPTLSVRLFSLLARILSYEKFK